MDNDKIERIAQNVIAFQHRDEGELRRYLERHPHADKSKHWVKPKVEHDEEIKKDTKKKKVISDKTAEELEKRIEQLKNDIEKYETIASKAKKEGKKDEALAAEGRVKSFEDKLEKLKETMKPYKDWVFNSRDKKKDKEVKATPKKKSSL